MYRPSKVDTNSPNETKAEKIFSGNGCLTGAAGASGYTGEGALAGLNEGIASTGRGLRTGITSVCFLCNCPAIASHAGGL